MIIIFRHSFAGSQVTDDHSRNLTNEGVRLAKERARALSNMPFHRVVSSTANRAVETANCFAATKNVPIDTDATLYLAPLVLLKNRILDPSNAGTLFVGHNPGLSQLLSTIDPRYMKSIQPCGGFAIEKHNGAWRIVDSWGVTT